MFVWCAFLFALGLLAFLDSMFNMGDIFRRVNSVLFMLISLGLLVRTTTKKKEKRLETYENRIFNLERQIETFRKAQKKLENY